MLLEKKVELLRKEKHKGRETKELLFDVKKLAEGEAFEYLMGEVLFCGAKVDLSMRPMIPRKETEFWVEQAIHSVRGSNEYLERHTEETAGKYPYKVLDLFSGSGCVGLAVLKNLPSTCVTFIELDSALKRQIELSCEKNKFAIESYDVASGDVFGEVKGLFDVIFAVPPYVPSQMKDEVMEELHAEPSLAFFDKEGGYYFHKKVLENVRHYLASNGTLFLEFDITQRVGIEDLVKKNNFFHYAFLQDPYGHECTIAIKTP